MKTLRNINPLGYVDVPLIGRQGPMDGPDGDEPGTGCLVPREEFDVSDEHAEILLAQEGNYELVDEHDDGLGQLKVAELRKYATDHDIDLQGASGKAAILAAIRKG